MSDLSMSDLSISQRPATRAGWEDRAAALRIEGRAFIDGHYVPAQSGQELRPRLADRRPNRGRGGADGAADVDLAVRRPAAAFEDGRWRDMAAGGEEAVMLRFAELIRATSTNWRCSRRSISAR